MDVLALLVDQLDRLLAERLDRRVRREAEAGSFPEDLWSELEAFGLPAVLLPEEAGGAGLDLADAGAIFQLLGRHAVPLPLGETMLAAWLLHRAELPIPDGVLTLADGSGLRGGAGRLAGELDAVPWGAEAEHVVVTIGEAGLVCCIAAPDLTPIPQTTIAREPRARFGLDHEAVLSGTAEGLALSSLDLGAMLRASQIAGALRRVLDLSVEYANTRVQFGRPIGKFQAVQQMLAVLAAEVAAAEVASATAWRDARAGGIGAAVAKVRCSDAARAGAAIAHQTHGAIGVTDEHVLHDYTRRLWSWRREFGTEECWAERIGREVLAREGAALWPWLAGERPG